MYRNAWDLHPHPRRRAPIRRKPSYSVSPTLADVMNSTQPGRARTQIPVKTTRHAEPSLSSTQPLSGESNARVATPSSESQTGRAETAPTLDTAPSRDTIDSIAPESIDWKAVAMRTQADMDNFKQRQKRRADEAISAEHERLLKAFLPIADNLRRALDHAVQGDASMQEGVELVHRQMVRLLEAEGATLVDTANQPFDPEVHEAIAVAPSAMPSGTIVNEIEAGYTLNHKLLRPARVVVAE